MLPSLAWYRDSVLQCASQARALNPSINAFISLVDRDAALSQHAASKGRWLAGEQKSPLDGVPYVVKDLFCTDSSLLDDQRRPIRTTCGSAILEHHVSPYASDILDRMSMAGMILLGKTNLDEFGMGSFSVRSRFGPCRNPLDQRYSTGGSSGGSAAAVAAQLAPVALGSDTGGSVRLPAAYCNTIGFKPSYGRLSRYGMIAHASSLDTVGLLCDRFDTLLSLWSSLAEIEKKAPPPRDSTCTSAPQPIPFISRKLRLGIIDESSWNSMLSVGDAAAAKSCQFPAILQTYWDGLERLRRSAPSDGLDLVPIQLPWLFQCLAAYYVLSCVEAASCLARFNGLCYGNNSDKKSLKTFVDAACDVRSSGFGPEVQRRILFGTFLSSSLQDEHRSYFQNARNFRALIQEQWATLFKVHSLHAVVVPLCAQSPPRVDQLLGSGTDRSIWSRPEQHWIQDIWTVPANLLGAPALSAPIPGQERLDFWAPPWQWMGLPGSDEELLCAVQQAHAWIEGK